ncbi:MAG: hypothetical protein NTY09_09865 [bacterium]|nr:hypothetical protein [bacterium]
MPSNKHEYPTDLLRGQFALFTLALCAVAMILASYIRFPAGDSWTHGWTVAEWMKGNFVLNDWASAIALPQQVLGWLVHIGTENLSWSRLAIVTALVTVLGCALAGRLPARLYPQWPQLQEWAPLFTFIMLAPTFTMKIAAGFMTDGYYLFFLVSSLYMLLSILDETSQFSNFDWIRKWVGFVSLATLSALQRTHGLLILLIVMLWVLIAKIIKPGKIVDKRFEGWRGWLPVGLSALGLLISIPIIYHPGFAPERSSEVTTEMLEFWTWNLNLPGFNALGPTVSDKLHIFAVLTHFGLAIIPIALIARMKRSGEERSKGNKVTNWWYVALGGAFILLMLSEWSTCVKNGLDIWFPYAGNSLTVQGFGPRFRTIALTAGYQLNVIVRIILTVLSILGGITLLWLISRTARIKGINWRSPSTLMGLIVLVHLGLIFINEYFFDRYLLPLMPFALMWLAPLIKDVQPKARLPIWIITLALFGFSMWGNADYLKWSGAKWDITNKALATGISSHDIVCGYEPDGYLDFNNETYPGLEFTNRWPTDIWWVDRLGLDIRPYYVVFEKGANPSSTVWERFVPTDIENDVMQVWRSPGNIESQ